MPLYIQTVAGGGAQFDGAAEATGLLDPGNVGGARFKVRINSVMFYTSGAITSWTMTIKDGSGTTVGTWLTDTTATFVAGGPFGLLELPAAVGDSYQLAFVTVGMAAAGTLTIDYDIVPAGGR